MLILKGFGINEQPLYGQIIMGIWVVSTIILFVIIHRDNINRSGVCG
jgi:ABC-type thiamin/hydroxymethylpyrimidine transport system permease subunit